MSLRCACQVFGECLKLFFAVVNELMESLALVACEFGQCNDALLICQGWQAKSERFKHRTPNAELAAALGCLLQLPLKRGLVDLPG